MSNQILFIGDSLTEWGNWDKLFPNKNIINFGVADNKTSDILNRIDGVFDYKPSKVFLMMGINDLGENIPVSEINNNYNKVVRKITKQWDNFELFLLGILPVDNTRWTKTGLTSKNISVVNKLISEIAKDYKATFINMTPYFIDNNNNLDSKLTTDGLHLSIDGYKVWKNIIEDYI